MLTMKIKLIFFIFVFIFLYLLSTFIFSFIKISNSVDREDHEMLSGYIIKNELSNNLVSNSRKYVEKNLQSLSKFLIIKNKDIDLSGQFSEQFILKTFQRSLKSISNELSNPKIMLYFYNNSQELNVYIQKYLLNLGYYSFEDYILEANIEQDIIIINKNNNFQETFNNRVKESYKIKINRLLSKINSTHFFFFISPMHFRLSVFHQDIPFTVIFKFQGHKWKISNIILDFQSILKIE